MNFFPAILGCLDYIYDENEMLFGPTKFISYLVSKFLEKSYEFSNLAFLGCNAGSPFQSVRPSTISPKILNTFLLSDLEETCYIDSFWAGICVVCIYLEILAPSPRILPFILNIFALSDLDETFYIDSFWDAICVVCIFFFEIPPDFEHFPIWMKLAA